MIHFCALKLLLNSKRDNELNSEFNKSMYLYYTTVITVYGHHSAANIRKCYPVKLILTYIQSFHKYDNIFYTKKLLLYSIL